MIRRSFLLSLAALAGAGQASANARFDDRGPWDSLADRGRVFLWHGGRLLRPAALVLAGKGGGLTMSLRDPLPQFDENRLDLDAAPLVRPTIGRRLVGATRIGPVYLSGPTLVADTAALPPRTPAVIAYRRQSWDVPRRLMVAADATDFAPSRKLAQARGWPVVGATYLTSTGLLVALDPTIIDPTDA
jgi:hypothetical protein